LHQWDSAEHGALTYLRQANESQRSDKVDAPRETGYLRDGPPRTMLKIDLSQGSLTGFEQPELSLIPARRVRHGKPAEQDFIGFYVTQDAASGLVRAPTAGCVGFSQRGDVFRASIDHGDAIEMTTIFRGQSADKWRAPARMKTMLGVERAEATEAGVDDPKLVVAIPRKLVDVDVAGDMNAARQIAGVQLAHRLQLFRQRRHVAVLPDGVSAADR